MLVYQKLPHPTATFACVNSGKGFINYFDGIFEKVKKLYIIKGGPGTGKSSLMRALAAEGEARGVAVLPILCSSDPNSLDGLLFPSLGIGVADGTAPHSMEARLPGAKEQLVDLGAFWNEQRLSAEKEQISALTTAKSASYSRAFHFFAAANEVEEAAHERLGGFVDVQKLSRAAERTAKRILALVPCGKRHDLPQKALSMSGAVRLTALQGAAKKIYSVERFYGAERYFMEALAEKSEHLSATVSPDPLTLSPDSIYFPAAGVLFQIGETEGAKHTQTFSTARFVNLPKRERTVLRGYHKKADDLVSAGLAEISEVAEAHFALERIYGEAMDFSKINGVKKELICKIFDDFTIIQA